MKISTKGRYALRLMFDLADHPGQKLSLKDIAKHQEISMKYLEQIVPSLTRAGLIRAVRGAQGGYTLLKSADEYTILEIIEAVEGKIAIVACLETPTNTCPRYSQCPTIHMYEELNENIINYFKSKTLQDLLENQVIDYII